jgi:hypothetical protein
LVPTRLGWRRRHRFVWQRSARIDLRLGNASGGYGAHGQRGGCVLGVTTQVPTTVVTKFRPVEGLAVINGMLAECVMATMYWAIPSHVARSVPGDNAQTRVNPPPSELQTSGSGQPVAAQTL